MTLPEADWRTFKKLRTVALERFSQQVLNECQEICRKESSTAHERYGELYGLLQERNRAMSHAFDDLRRSTAVVCLKLMYKLGLVTEQELTQFSSEVRRIVSGEP
jgi:hypothetical protein